MVFDKPGVVIIGCNIHEWMLAYVVAVETPWFAKTDANGGAKLAGLPSGRYRVHVWYPGLDTSAEAHDIELSGDQQIQTEWRLTTEPASPPRRAPLPGADDYR